VQITRNPYPVSSAFSWSSDGQLVAHIMDECVCVTSIATGLTQRVTARSSQWCPPRPEACVFSPDGASIAFVRRVRTDDQEYNQIFVAAL
jgi:Tol biopolymer transport system component